MCVFISVLLFFFSFFSVILFLVVFFAAFLCVRKVVAASFRNELVAPVSKCRLFIMLDGIRHELNEKENQNRSSLLSTAMALEIWAH